MSDTETMEAAQRLLATLVAGRSALLHLASAHLPVSRAAALHLGSSTDTDILELLHGTLDRRMVVAARRVVLVESRATPAADAKPLRAGEPEGRTVGSTRLQRALLRHEPRVESARGSESGDGEPAPEEAAPRKVETYIEPPAPGVEPDAADTLPPFVPAIAAAAVAAAVVAAPEAEPEPVEPEVAEPEVAPVAEAAPVVEAAPEVAEPVVVAAPPVEASEAETEVALEDLPLQAESTAELRALIGETAPVAEPTFIADADEPDFVAPDDGPETVADLSADAEVVSDAVIEPSDADLPPVDVDTEVVPDVDVAPVAAVAAVAAAAVVAAPVDVREPPTDADVPARVTPSEEFADPPQKRSTSDLRKSLQAITRGRQPAAEPAKAEPARLPDERTDPSMASPVARGTPRIRAQEEESSSPLQQARPVGPAAVRVAGAEDDLGADMMGADDDSGELGVGEAVGAGLRVGKKKDEKSEPHAPRLTEDDEAEAPAAPVHTPTAPTAADDSRVDAMLKDANTQADRGEFAKAIQTYSDALDVRFDRVDAYIGRGRCHLELGDYSSAMSDFQRAEDLSPDRPEAHVAMGDLYFARKEYRRAIECYDQAVELDGSHAMARCRRGISHYYRKNYRQAYQDLQRALTLDPEIPNIRKYVQMASKKMERPD